jgi:monothiol glutaredoxin
MDTQMKETIETDVKSNKVVVYMRGTPEAPRCGFSARVVKVFKELQVPFYTMDMDATPGLWPALTEMNNWPTSPQIFVNGEFVGGCDIVCEMAKNGELSKMLSAT